MKKIADRVLNGLLVVCLVWTVFAISFEVTMLTLSYANPKLATRISHELSWKLDGTFKK